MKIKKVLLTSVVLIITFFVIYFYIPKKEISGDFTSNDIRKVKVGMTLEEVQNILGQPFEVTSGIGIHKMTCEKPKKSLKQDLSSNSNIRDIVNEKFSETDFCCEAYKNNLKNKKSSTLVYTKRVSPWMYPMLWVHLDDSFKVSSVYAKEYKGFDDSGIYLLNKKVKSENKDAFEKYFN